MEVQNDELVKAQDLHNVRKFLTQMWMHPLLTAETTQHRESFKPTIEKACKELGIDLNSFVALLVGSSVWIVNDHSDFDASIFHTKDSALPYGTDWVNHTNDPRYKDSWGRMKSDFDIHCSHTLPTDFSEPPDLITANQKLLLFVTPDEFCVGNIEYLHRLRQEAIADIPNHFDIYTYWDKPNSAVDHWFQQWRKGWGKEPPKEFSDFPKLWNRHDRLEATLKQRASQTHSTNLYDAAFREALEKFRLPSFETVSNAVEADNGRLTLLPQYAAEGIKK